MPAPANLVHEISTSTGTGNLTLAAVNGKVRFSDATYGFGTGVTTDVFDYFIANRSAGEWEIGTGHMSDANTLVRDTVVASSNADAAVNFSAGTKDVTNDVPAAEQLRRAGGQTLTGGFLSDSYPGGTISSGTYTPAPAAGQENIQHIVNGGAFALAPPASPCTVLLQILNNASAGEITTLGFTMVTGDSFDTTDTNKFMCFIAKTNDYSLLNVVALQ